MLHRLLSADATLGITFLIALLCYLALQILGGMASNQRTEAFDRHARAMHRNPFGEVHGGPSDFMRATPLSMLVGVVQGIGRFSLFFGCVVLAFRAVTFLLRVRGCLFA